MTNECPHCKIELTAASFVKIDQSHRSRPAVRILNVPLVMRHDTNEATNNLKGAKLFGHPHLVKLPSKVDARDIWETVKRVASQEAIYTLLFVAGEVCIPYRLYKALQTRGRLQTNIILGRFQILPIHFFSRNASVKYPFLSSQRKANPSLSLNIFSVTRQ
jgi:hypothetical protein